MVYYLTWQAGEEPRLPSDWEQYLSHDRIEKAKGYKLEKDRTACVFSYLLLRYALFCQTQLKELIKMQTDANGKPFDPCGRFHFNISHCDTAIACAVDFAPIGVDVQDFRTVRENVVKKVCSEEEQKLLAETEHPEQLFAAFWTGKEAYGKYKGFGIGYELKDHTFCPFDQFPQTTLYEKLKIHTAMYDRFSLSVCSEQTQLLREVKFTQLQTFVESFCG